MVRTDKRTELKSLLKGKEIYSKRNKEQAIDTLLFNACISGGNLIKKGGIPGELVKAMPKDFRDILDQCTAEDWNRRLEKTNWIKR
jgi:hypothetical protein